MYIIYHNLSHYMKYISAYEVYHQSPWIRQSAPSNTKSHYFPTRVFFCYLEQNDRMMSICCGH